jgi:hypothetical protein
MRGGHNYSLVYVSVQRVSNSENQVNISVLKSEIQENQRRDASCALVFGPYTLYTPYTPYTLFLKFRRLCAKKTHF